MIFHLTLPGNSCSRATSRQASCIFNGMTYVLYMMSLSAGLMAPMVSAQALLRLFGCVLTLVGLKAMGRLLSALRRLDPVSAFGDMGSSGEMTHAAIAELAM